MPKFNRRQLMAAGAAIAAGGTVGSVSTVADEHDEGEEDPELPPFEEPDSWSSYYGTAGNTGSIPTTGAFPEPETRAWEHDESGHVAVADGRVYLRSGSEVHSLDDGDGSVVWTSGELGAEGGVEYGTPAVADETVVVGGDGLMALDADSGDVRWSQEFNAEGGEAVTSPTVAFDTVFVVADEALQAFDLADGELRWSQESVELEPHEESEADDSQEVTFVSTPAAVANEFVYAGVGHDDRIGFAAFDVRAGETQWTYTVDERMAPDDVHDFILATANRVYTGTISDIGLDYPVLDSWTGEEVAREGEYSFRPAVTDEIQVGVGRVGFTVQNLETGDEWGESGISDSWRQPAIAGETLVIPHFLGNGGAFEGVARDDGVYGFDLTDGTEQWYFTHPDVDINDVGDRHGFIVSGETIYVTGRDQLQALRPETEEEPEEEPEDEPVEEAPSLELSVSAPDSIARDETACFDVTVRNHSGDTIELTVMFEIGDITESLTVEIAANEHYASFHTVAGSDLCPGDTDWTVTADGGTESGVLTVIDG